MLKSCILKLVLSRNCCKFCIHTSAFKLGVQGKALGDNEEIPRITIPQNMVSKWEKQKYKKNLRESKVRKVEEGVQNLIISCNRKEYNHYRSQTYSEFEPRMLASHGWKHDKSKGDHFTILSWKKNPAHQSEFSSFSEMNLSPNLVQTLESCKYKIPTNIQAKVIPELLKGESVLCAAETGNGKTLAFLIPALERILQVRKTSTEEQSLNQPIAVIIAPGRELAEQIYSVAEKIGNQLGIAVDLKCGGSGTQKILRDMEVKPIDLLVATPGVLVKLLSNRMYRANRLSMIVFDEVDSMLDDSFSEMTTMIIRRLGVAVVKPEEIESNVEEHADLEEIQPNKVIQVALVGATMPKNIRKKLDDLIEMDSVKTITTEHLHHILPHVVHKFLRLGPAQKLDHLLKVVTSNMERKIPTIVFCNTPDTCRFLSLTLESMNIKSICFHADMPQKARAGLFSSFVDGETDLLICTDLASRGLDTSRALHVINYDFPNFISDYVHRSGRVGRVNSPHGCFVLSFVTRYWDVDLVWRIEKSIRCHTELDNVNANIKRKLEGRHKAKQLMKDMENMTQTENTQEDENNATVNDMDGAERQ